MRARAGIHTEKTLLEIARIAYFDPAEVLSNRGGIKDIGDMDPGARVCIVGYEVEELFEGRDKDRVQVGTLKKLKFADKLGALDKLMKIDNMIIEKTDNEPKGDVIFNITGFGGKNLMSSKQKA